MSPGSEPKAFSTALLFTLCFGLGCQDEPEHPPLQGCSEVPCNPPGQNPGQGGPVVGGGGSGGGGSGGAAGGGGKAAASTLTGTVVELLDDDFRRSQPFTSSASIHARGARGGVVRSNWDGIGPFALSGFEAADPTWVLVEPAANRGVFPTLHPVDPASDASLTLSVVRTDTVQLILQLVSIPEEPAPGAAQLVLLFTQGSGTGTTRGLAGVRVELPSATSISYAASGSWSDLVDVTDASGAVFLGNIAAPAFPGVTQRVEVSGSRSATFEVRLASNAVSLVQVPLPPP